MIEKRLIELLTRKMAGESSKDELSELHALLSIYPEAKYEEELFRQIWESETQSTENVNAYYLRHKEKFKEALQFDEPAPIALPSKNRKRHLIVAVVIGLLFITGVAYFFNNSGRRHELHKQIIAAKGVRKSLMLPDGTKVWLNAESQLSYDPAMQQADVRLVTLSGEAYFNVADDISHPFIIKTGKLSIKVAGTSVNVKAYPMEHKSIITLVKGAAELTLNDDSRKRIILKPSEKCSLIEDGKGPNLQTGPEGKTMFIDHLNMVKVQDKEYILETSWTENRLMFENETLKDLAPRLERWYNVKITILNNDVMNTRFSGAFTNKTIDEVLSSLQSTAAFKFNVAVDAAVIY